MNRDSDLYRLAVRAVGAIIANLLMTVLSVVVIVLTMRVLGVIP